MIAGVAHHGPEKAQECSGGREPAVRLPRFIREPRQRLHQSLGYKTPEQFEAENVPALAA